MQICLPGSYNLIEEIGLPATKSSDKRSFCQSESASASALILRSELGCSGVNETESEVVNSLLHGLMEG